MKEEVVLVMDQGALAIKNLEDQYDRMVELFASQIPDAGFSCSLRDDDHIVFKSLCAIKFLKVFHYV